jgi:hypothetical protein
MATDTLATLLVLFPALAAMRLRWPRPPLRVVLLQPGFIAFEACAVCASLTYGTMKVWPDSALEKALVLACALAVPLAWGVLLATRRWRPEPRLIDRLGRLLGATWWISSWVALASLHGLFGWPRQ